VVEQAAEKVADWVQCAEGIPQGLKPEADYAALSARLKSCPDTKLPQILVRREFFRSL
jgi:hypothetical protein